MRPFFPRHFLLPLLFAVSISCNELVVTNGPSGDLIANQSFEYLGQPSWTGWTAEDTSAAHIVRGAPPGGGTWSLKTELTWLPAVGVLTTIPLSPGNHRYLLTFWGKYHGLFGGRAMLSIHNVDRDTLLKSTQVTDTIWSTYSLSDTLTASFGDTLVVELSGGGTELGFGSTWFDLVRLEQL